MQINKFYIGNAGWIALLLAGTVVLSSCGESRTVLPEALPPSSEGIASSTDVSNESSTTLPGGTSGEEPTASANGIPADTPESGTIPDSEPDQTDNTGSSSFPGTSGMSDTSGTSGTTGTIPTETPLTETQQLLRTYHGALDNLMNAACAESILTGRTTATLFGGVKFEQDTKVTRRFVRNGSVLDAVSWYDSTSSLKTIRQTVVKTASGYSVQDKDGSPSAYEKADYLAAYGIAPETFVPYIIEEDTLLSAPTRSVSGGATRITFSLHPQKAAEAYARSVKAMVGSTAEFLGMNSITVTAKIENGILTGMTIEESYTMKMVIRITCTSKFEQTFQNIGSGIVKDW